MTTRTRRARVGAVIEVIRLVLWVVFSGLLIWGAVTGHLMAVVVAGFALIGQELADIKIKVDTIEARQRWH